jgi:rSAM/selenodomain-associated transferase 1
MKENCLILMVKCPRRGKVKRRLSRSIGDLNALEFYKRSGSDILERIKGNDHDVLVGYYPVEDQDCIRSWLGDENELIPQVGEDLGERQALLLSTGFEKGYSRVCVMASDSPDIPMKNITEAFTALMETDCVIGPSPDGGYYLIGFSRESFHKELFMEMKWSNSYVVDEMKRRLELQGIKWKEIMSWQDVDNIDDLRDLIQRNPEGTGPVRTMEFLRRLDLH